MRIGKVIGTVTLNQAHPSMSGATFKLAVPLALNNLSGRTLPQAEEFAVYDELGAGVGSLIAISEGAEAAQPFRPELKPIDSYAAAILDNVELNAR